MIFNLRLILMEWIAASSFLVSIGIEALAPAVTGFFDRRLDGDRASNDGSRLS